MERLARLNGDRNMQFTAAKEEDIFEDTKPQTKPKVQFSKAPPKVYTKVIVEPAAYHHRHPVIKQKSDGGSVKATTTSVSNTLVSASNETDSSKSIWKVM